MTRKQMVNDWINDMEQFGETYIGSTEIMGVKEVVKNYNALCKEVAKRYPGTVVCWNNENGACWMA